MDGYEGGAPTTEVYKVLRSLGDSCPALPLAFRILRRWAHARTIIGEHMLNERALAIMMIHAICRRMLKGRTLKETFDKFSMEEAATKIIANFFDHFEEFEFRFKVITFDKEGENLKKTQRAPKDREGYKTNAQGQRIIRSYIQVKDPCTGEDLTPDVTAAARYQHIRRELKHAHTMIQANNGRPEPASLGLQQNGLPAAMTSPDFEGMKNQYIPGDKEMGVNIGKAPTQ
jgi:hypothetical protein